MGLASRIQVDLPKSGIIIRKTGKHKYVYKVLKTFRNEKGQPSNLRVSIGKLDSDTGRLIPNNNYYEHYCDTVITDKNEAIDFTGFDSVKSIGGSFLADKLAENNGVTQIIHSIFDEKRARLILLAATHMMLNGNVFEGISDWCAENLISSAKLTSPGASALFASISYDERMNFFKKWINANSAKDSYYAYDVTSFSTYANGIADAEFGYNRDGEDLPQINFGCYFGQQSGLPIFYVTYPGSIVDKSHLQYMMAYNKDLGISSIKFIMDKGFCTTDNLKFMRAQGYRFLMATDNRNKSISNAIDCVRDNIQSMKNRVKEGLYSMSHKGEFYGVNATLHIFYQPLLAETQRTTLERRIEALEYQLSSLSTLTKKDAKSYRRYFNLEFSDNGNFSYSYNYAAIDEATKNYGYLCLITNFDVDSADALDIYRRKDSIEKGFDDIKNHSDMKRLKTHTTATTDGKMFCAFIALILVCSLTNLLRSSNKLRMSKHEAFAALAKIRLVITNDGKRLINPLSKTQRLILEACGLTPLSLLDYIRVHPKS